MSRRPGSRTVLAGTLALLLVACGDDGPRTNTTPDGATGKAASSTTTEPLAPHAIEFVKGLAAGREAAGGDDALLFVYVARHKPT